MKQALYYAIRNNLHSTVIAVTSEKGTRRWHGRDTRYNETTHGTFDQLRGRFETKEAAEAVREKIAAVSKAFDHRRLEVSKYQSFLSDQERQAIIAVMQDREPAPFPESVLVSKQWVASHNAEWFAGGTRAGTMAEAAARATAFLHERGGGIIVVRPVLTPKE